MADLAAVIERLKLKGFEILDQKRLPNDSGTQLFLDSKQVVNLYDNGRLFVQGSGDKATVEAALDGLPGVTAARASGTHVTTVSVPTNNDVFVVYGHDEPARTQLEAMLRRWGLNPLILDQLPSEGQTLIEKLEHYADQVRFAVVLATPDDEGHRTDHPDEKQFRARQNVVLELGMLLARLGRPRVAILMRNTTNMERPSDIQGLIYIPFTDNVEETKVPLSKEMDKQGIDIPVGKL